MTIQHPSAAVPQEPPSTGSVQLSEEVEKRAESFMLRCEFLGGMAWTEKTHDRFLEFFAQELDAAVRKERKKIVIECAKKFKEELLFLKQAHKNIYGFSQSPQPKK